MDPYAKPTTAPTIAVPDSGGTLMLDTSDGLRQSVKACPANAERLGDGRGITPITGDGSHGCDNRVKPSEVAEPQHFPYVLVPSHGQLLFGWSDLRAGTQFLMHGVAPLMCDQVGRPLLDRGAGGRSPGYLADDKITKRRRRLSPKILQRVPVPKPYRSPCYMIEQRFPTAQSGFLPRHGSPHAATRSERLCFPSKAGLLPLHRS
jgi:hypothetical protein